MWWPAPADHLADGEEADVEEAEYEDDFEEEDVLGTSDGEEDSGPFGEAELPSEGEHEVAPGIGIIKTKSGGGFDFQECQPGATRRLLGILP